MTWFGPGDCEENCCGECEDIPVVTCGRSMVSYVDTFEYTVEDAVEAWIIENCDGVETRTDITLDEFGDASGSIEADADCTYTVYAATACAIRSCTDACDQIDCSLSIERVQDEITAEYTGAIRITYEYAVGEIGTAGGEDEIVTADIDGVDVLGDPITDSGTLEIDVDDLSDPIVFTLTNSCGRVKTCSVDIPCCWKSHTLRVSITGVSDQSFSCSNTGIHIIGFQRQTLRERSWESTGLDQLNGTFLFGAAYNCVPFDTHEAIEIGTVTFESRDYSEGTDLFSGVAYTDETIITTSGTMYFYMSSTTVWGFYWKPFPTITTYHKVTSGGVTTSETTTTTCQGGGTPPCSDTYGDVSELDNERGAPDCEESEVVTNDIVLQNGGYDITTRPYDCTWAYPTTFTDAMELEYV